MNGIEGRKDERAPTLRCGVCGAFHAGQLPDDRQHRLAVIYGIPSQATSLAPEFEQVEQDKAPARRFWTHKRVSYLKSGVRIKACVLAALMPDAHTAVVVLALGLGAAEWLGVWEEMGGRG